MRSRWFKDDGTCAALSTWQYRAVSLGLLLIIFALDVTTTFPIATAYFAVIAVTFWSVDRWQPLAAAAISVVLVFLALVFNDKGLPREWLLILSASGSMVLLATGWLITKHRDLIVASMQREMVLRTIFDSEPGCVKLLGPDYTLIEMNRGGLAMIEVDSLDAVKGRNMLALIQPLYRASFAELARQVFEGKSGSLQLGITGLRGTRRWLETHGAPLRDKTGRITAMLAVSHDITLRKQAEAQLRDSEQRLRQAASIAGLGFFEHDHHTNRVYWSEGALEIMDAVRDATPEVAAAIEWRDRCLASIATAADPTGDGTATVEHRIVRPDGEIRHVSIRSQTQFVDTPQGRVPVRTLGTVFDITERNRAEEQRDALALRVLEVQEDERRAVARDLHDEIGQALSALKLNLLGLRRDASDPARVVTDSLRIADEVLRQVRDLALSLRPVALDDLGLGAAVQWYVEQTAARTGLDLKCFIEPGLPAASPVTEIACFRVLQEALTNVHRHARATRALVGLSWHGTSLELVVRDDGAGFNPAGMTREIQSGHMGLKSMHERAALLRGKVRVTSAPGAGCEVRVTFPLAVPTDRTTTGVGV